jgi:hypothetical protein
MKFMRAAHQSYGDQSWMDRRILRRAAVFEENCRFYGGYMKSAVDFIRVTSRCGGRPHPRWHALNVVFMLAIYYYM